MVPIGDVDNLDALADVLGCKVGISRVLSWYAIGSLSHTLFGI